MAYVKPNFKTKKELKEALKHRHFAPFVLDDIVVFQPGLGRVPANGKITLEGPHYPEAHRWYAIGEMVDGRLVSVK
jgi:hypothetical protein